MKKGTEIQIISTPHLETMSPDVLEFFGKIRTSKEKDSMRITFFMKREGGSSEEIYIDVPEGIVREFSLAVIESWAKFYLKKKVKITTEEK